MSKVSVIIPTYNRSALLPRAIESAKTAGSDVEVIVVDDASTDATPKVCQSIQGIRYIRLRHNTKLAGARNAGIRASSGEYLVFLDDDDQRLPGSIDTQVRVLESHPEAAFVYGPVLVGDPQTCIPTGEIHPHKLLTGDLFWSLLEGNFIYLPSVVTRRKCIENVDLFDATVKGTEDWLVWIRLAEQHPIVAVEEPVAIYRRYTRTSGQLSSNRIAMSKASALVQAKGLRLPRALGVSREKRKAVRKRFLNQLSLRLIDEAYTDLSQENYHSALAHCLASLRYDPLRMMRAETFRRLAAMLLRWMQQDSSGLRSRTEHEVNHATFNRNVHL